MQNPVHSLIQKQPQNKTQSRAAHKLSCFYYTINITIRQFVFVKKLNLTACHFKKTGISLPVHVNLVHLKFSWWFYSAYQVKVIHSHSHGWLQAYSTDTNILIGVFLFSIMSASPKQWKLQKFSGWCTVAAIRHTNCCTIKNSIAKSNLYHHIFKYYFILISFLLFQFSAINRQKEKHLPNNVSLFPPLIMFGMVLFGVVAGAGFES